MENKKIILEPTNGRKSFYNKCFILETPEGDLYLKSYDCTMAVFTKRGSLQFVNIDKISTTTANHIRSFMVFLEIYELENITKKDIIKQDLYLIDSNKKIIKILK